MDHETYLTEADLVSNDLAEDYDLEHLSDDVYPLDFKLIAYAQRHGDELLDTVRQNLSKYETKPFRGSDIL
eukprot:scaffold81888_cov90-Attheya_sp.AAC.1